MRRCRCRQARCRMRRSAIHSRPMDRAIHRSRNHHSLKHLRLIRRRLNPSPTSRPKRRSILSTRCTPSSPSTLSSRCTRSTRSTRCSPSSPTSRSSQSRRCQPRPNRSRPIGCRRSRQNPIRQIHRHSATPTRRCPNPSYRTSHCSRWSRNSPTSRSTIHARSTPCHRAAIRCHPCRDSASETAPSEETRTANTRRAAARPACRGIASACGPPVPRQAVDTRTHREGRLPRS